ncbi:UNVERIFIED_ORG: putative membrane protein [Arthrobacter globiformis]|nr:putative membrane protein [Arthrobacter globiformis]
MQTVEETVDVAVPAASAFEQWARFASFPQFMSVVESVDEPSATVELRTRRTSLG